MPQWNWHLSSFKCFKGKNTMALYFYKVYWFTGAVALSGANPPAVLSAPCPLGTKHANVNPAKKGNNVLVSLENSYDLVDPLKGSWRPPESTDHTLNAMVISQAGLQKLVSAVPGRVWGDEWRGHIGTSESLWWQQSGAFLGGQEVETGHYCQKLASKIE